MLAANTNAKTTKRDQAQLGMERLMSDRTLARVLAHLEASGFAPSEQLCPLCRAALRGAS